MATVNENTENQKAVRKIIEGGLVLTPRLTGGGQTGNEILEALLGIDMAQEATAFFQAESSVCSLSHAATVVVETLVAQPGGLCWPHGIIFERDGGKIVMISRPEVWLGHWEMQSGEWCWIE